MSKILDYNGLEHYDEKIKNYINEHGGADNIITINRLDEILSPEQLVKCKSGAIMCEID